MLGSGYLRLGREWWSDRMSLDNRYRCTDRRNIVFHIRVEWGWIARNIYGELKERNLASLNKKKWQTNEKTNYYDMLTTHYISVLNYSIPHKDVQLLNVIFWSRKLLWEVRKHDCINIRGTKCNLKVNVIAILNKTNFLWLNYLQTPDFVHAGWWFLEYRQSCCHHLDK